MIKCPRCLSPAKELLICDRCGTIGCIRCIIKRGKEWACEKCKSKEAKTPESALATMFDF